MCHYNIYAHEMTDIKNILYYLLVGMVMVSCSFADDIADDPNCQQVAKQVDLLVTVGDKASMPRRVSASASRRAPEFSTMDLMVAIPFRTNGANVTASDDPLIDLVGANEDNLAKQYDAEKYNTYYVNTCHLMTGTDRMLVYGKATKPSTTNPAVYG